MTGQLTGLESVGVTVKISSNEILSFLHFYVVKTYPVGTEPVVLHSHAFLTELTWNCL